MRIYLIIFLSLCSFAVSFTQDMNLIKRFTNQKHIRFVFYYHCAEFKEMVTFVKNLNDHQVRVAEFFISNNQTTSRNFLKSVDRNFKMFSKKGFIVDGECEFTNILLTIASELNLFSDTIHWLIFTITEVEELLENLRLNINSNVLLIVKNENTTLQDYEKNITIKETFNPAYNKGGKLIIHTVIKNKQLREINFNFKENKYWRRKNMTGIIFKTKVVVVNHNFQGKLEDYITRESDYRLDSRTRFHSILMDHCRHIYNFSLDISSTDSWGFQLPNGSFDGMTGALQRHEVDIGGSLLFLKNDRIPVVSHGRSTWILKNVFLFRNLNKKTFNEIFIYPLNSIIWYLVILFTLIIVILLKIMFMAETKIFSYLKNQMETSWSSLVIFTLGAFCQQGSPTSPLLLSGKFTALTLFVFCVLFYQYYSGSMVSFLLTKQPSNIRNIRDIVESPLEVGFQNIVYVKAYFRETTDPTAKKLYKKSTLKSKKNCNFYSPEEGLKLVEQENFAFYVETSAGYPIISETFSDKSICALEEIIMIPPQTSHIATVKYSPFLDLLNVCMQYLTEVGIVNRQRKIWDAQKPECIDSSASFVAEADLLEMYPILLIFFAGVISSFLIFFLEMLHFKNYRINISSTATGKTK